MAALEKIHHEGRQAFRFGRSIKENPYQETLAARNWANGWRHAWFVTGQQKLRGGVLC